MRTAITTALGRLDGRPEVANLSSYYSTKSPTLVATDRHSTCVVIQLRDGDLAAKKADLATIAPLLQAGPAVQTEIGGDIAFFDDANAQVRKDIFRAEVFSLPVLLVLLVLIFGGVLPALTPLLIGVVATLGSFIVTRALTQVTEVSVFATNVITLLSLGMAVDYSLFVVSRFREELVNDRPIVEAMRRTVSTAGRTVVVSGLTVALALSSLLLFPIGFLHSMAYGGMAAVLVAMLAALTALPAVLSLLGHRAKRRERAAPPGQCRDLGPAGPQRHEPAGVLHHRGGRAATRHGHAIPAGPVRRPGRAGAAGRHAEPRRGRGDRQ
jgi:RND superfamily putative drug exporter